MKFICLIPYFLSSSYPYPFDFPLEFVTKVAGDTLGPCSDPPTNALKPLGPLRDHSVWCDFDTFCYNLIHFGTTLVQFDTFKYNMLPIRPVGTIRTPFDTFWYVLVQFETFCYNLLPIRPIGTIWYNLIHFDTIWYNLIHVGTICYRSSLRFSLM